ncbi:hypothetical protein DY000_02024338 [Brassica cretica]|uniref:Uncharacterized protein n=1 Tax=Brassica cretica TaxID=69181 RepID=A0ABQ7E0S6_BRACR|nr:hypothetical protein DY000_02024338 [Brassica cretica]
MGSVARVFYYVQGIPPLIPLPRLLLAYCHRPQKNGSLCLLKSQFRGALCTTRWMGIHIWQVRNQMGLELPNDMLMELMSTWILRSVVKRLVVVEEISEFAVIYDGLNVNGKSLFTVAKE